MADLSDFTRRYLEDVERRVDKAAAELETRLKDACPIAAENGGTMRDNTTARATGVNVEVVVGVEYASFTIEDTQPHEIRARRAQALRFFWSRVGPPQPRFYRRVQHPGTSGVIDWYHEVLDDWPRILERVA